MADMKTPANPLFLRDDDLRQGIEMLFFAYRDFTAKADETLAQYGFGRAHHRVIYFVGRNPDMTVSDLLDILKITKQSLSRVLGQLVITDAELDGIKVAVIVGTGAQGSIGNLALQETREFNELVRELRQHIEH